MSALLATAQPRRIKASHRRRRKIAAGRFVQRYYDPITGRFLSVDPIVSDLNTGANFNSYWYANNNPYRFTDPDGRYGRGAGFDGAQWHVFNNAQQARAEKVDAAIQSLEAIPGSPQAAEGLKSKFEQAFGSGSATPQNMALVAGELKAISTALHSDGSDGYVADSISSAQMTEKVQGTGANGQNVLAAAEIGGKKMFVNEDHAAAGNKQLLSEKIGHEAGHNAPAGLQDQYSGEQKAYSHGTPEQKAAYDTLKQTNTNRTVKNPDNLMEFVESL